MEWNGTKSILCIIYFSICVCIWCSIFFLKVQLEYPTTTRNCTSTLCSTSAHVVVRDDRLHWVCYSCKQVVAEVGRVWLSNRNWWVVGSVAQLTAASFSPVTNTQNARFLLNNINKKTKNKEKLEQYSNNSIKNNIVIIQSMGRDKKPTYGWAHMGLFLGR